MSSEKTTLETIESVVSWYAGRPRDFADIDRLLYAAKTLATALFTFSGEVGALYKQKNRTEFQRKAGFLAAYRELMAAEPRPSVAAAEKEAETAVLDLRSEEQQADAEYTAAKMAARNRPLRTRSDAPADKQPENRTLRQDPDIRAFFD